VTKAKAKQPAGDYFAEAAAWDDDLAARAARSERRAWFVAGVATTVALVGVAGLAVVAARKDVAPFVIRVDNNTGVTDVVSVLTETDGAVKESAQEALDKYWLGQYIRSREGYLWDTRAYDRETVGLLSNHAVQQDYAALTDPKSNPQAPVALYGENAAVETKIKTIGFLNKGEEKNEEKRVTALVRYIKTLKRNGTQDVATHWAATVTFVYSDADMDMDARGRNPLGFQVVGYRNDPEVGG
jgi:type IV secretion system protein VirB8